MKTVTDTASTPSGSLASVDVPTLDVARVRADFPIFDRLINGHPLVYLDSANTSQKPRQVIDALREHYEVHNANVARSVHTLGTESTAAYEGARAKVATFIGAAGPDEVVFTKNSTEAINLVAYAFGNASVAPTANDARFVLRPGDEIVISEMEHHSNIVPWQMLCERTGATLKWFGVTDEGRLDLSRLDEVITERTKLVSIAHVSNTLGTINDSAPIIAAGPRGRCARHAGRIAVGAADAGRRRRARRRLPRVHRSQDARPDRHRRAVGRDRRCCRRCRRSSVAAR